MRALSLSLALLTAFWFCAWIVKRRGRSVDPIIDGLLAANKFKPRPNMEATDWTRVDQIGRSRWDEAVKAQERKR